MPPPCFPPLNLIRPAVTRIDKGPVSLWHFRRMFPIAGVTRWARSPSASAVACFGSIARAVPWLVPMILANPTCALADVAFRLHSFIVGCPPVFPAALNADPMERPTSPSPFAQSPQDHACRFMTATMRSPVARRNDEFSRATRSSRENKILMRHSLDGLPVARSFLTAYYERFDRDSPT
jgi:hypothetical protein